MIKKIISGGQPGVERAALDAALKLNIPHGGWTYKNVEQALYVSAELPQTGRVMVKDEDICVHCGLCAERCPTGAWDMQKSELLVPYAADQQPVDPPKRATGASGS